MKTFKKTLALFLCVLTVFSLSTVAFAAQEITPVIVVSGMASFPLYDGESEEQVYPPSTKGIMSVVGKSVLPFSKEALTGDWNYFAEKTFKNVFDGLFEIISCDKNGNSLHNIKAPSFPLSVNNYPEILNHENEEDEQGVVKGLAAALGGENVYFYNYDWRLDPLESAEGLSNYIENVKKEKGVQKVTLVPCSMGGIVTNCYLYKYGSESVKKIVYCLVASKGLDLVGELFSKNLEIKTDMLLERLFSFERGDILTQTLISVLETGLSVTPSLKAAVDKFVAAFLEKTNDKAYDELLSISFASMPGMWSFCPDEYYETAKKEMFKNGVEKAFLDRIDEYHYNVQNNAEKLMTKAKESKTEIYVTASYGYVGFPVTQKGYEQSDCLVETKNESFGATCAPYGENFSDDYKAVGTVCKDEKHTHVSTDGIVDASTCLFPEQTWFIKYMKHVGFKNNTEASKLLVWLVSSETPLSVSDENGYPQFTEFNNTTGKLKSLTGDEIKHSVLDERFSVKARLAEFLHNLYSLIMNLFDKIKK